MSEVTTFYLEMNSPNDLKSKVQPSDFDVIEAEVKDFQINRFLYQLVGKKWGWTDKLSHSDKQWEEFAESDNLRTWVAYSKGSIAGYYELEMQEGNQIEIICFGLTPKFLGKGFGGYLLSHAIRSAWSWGSIERVWVHTCTLDHESALSNYQSRGMKLFKTEPSSVF